MAVGPFLDRFGPRWLLTLALLVLGGTLLLMAWITSLWQFYALQILGRIVAMGVLSIASSVVVPKWFIRKRGRAVALSSMGMRAGNTVTPLYVQLFVSIGNWRVAAGLAGLVVWVVSLLPAAILLRRRPEDLGCSRTAPRRRGAGEGGAGSSVPPSQLRRSGKSLSPSARCSGSRRSTCWSRPLAWPS